MEWYYWILIIFFIGITIAIILGVTWKRQANRNRPLPINPEDFTRPYANPNHWDKPKPVGDAKCQVYTFRGEQDPVRRDRVIMGQPSYSTAVLDRMRGTDIRGSCLDSDQIMAVKSTRTCIPLKPNEAPGASYCYRNDGTLAQVGETETFYNPCEVPTCPGNLALVSLPFHPQDDCKPRCHTSLCIVATPLDQPNLILEPCGAWYLGEVFRVTRKNPGGQPDPNQNVGLMTRIHDRLQVRCLTIREGKVTFDTCTPNQGYVWMEIPSYPDEKGVRPPGQIAYIGDFKESELKKFDFTTIKGLQQFISSNKLQVLAPRRRDGQPVERGDTCPAVTAPDPLLNGLVVLAPYVVTGDSLDACLQTARIVDYNLYNVIMTSNDVNTSFI